jgi:hypothetical protein
VRKLLQLFLTFSDGRKLRDEIIWEINLWKMRSLFCLVWPYALAPGHG